MFCVVKKLSGEENSVCANEDGTSRRNKYYYDNKSCRKKGGGAIKVFDKRGEPIGSLLLTKLGNFDLFLSLSPVYYKSTFSLSPSLSIRDGRKKRECDVAALLRRFVDVLDRLVC